MKRVLLVTMAMSIAVGLALVPIAEASATGLTEYEAVVTASPELPATIQDPPGSGLSGFNAAANFLATFGTVSQVCIEVEFEDDLLDYAEILTFNWADGQIWRDNNTNDPFASATTCTTSAHEAMNDDARDGTVDIRVEIMEAVGFASVNVTSMKVIATGTAAAPPSTPTDLTSLESMDGWLYFSGHTPETGYELWRSDGDVIALVADIAPGPVDSAPSDMEAMGGWIYFEAETPYVGEEVWRTNGVTTELVADIVPGPDSSFPREFEELDGWVYFATWPIPDLWRTNGTMTEPVDLEIPGIGGVWSPHFFESMDGWLYFTGDSAIDFRLFRTDGVTMEWVVDISGDPENGEWPYEKEAMDGWVYFSAEDWGELGRELWRTNGTDTELVADVHPIRGGGSDPGGFEAMDGWLYFSAWSDTLGGLWRTDGVTTQHVSELDPGGSPAAMDGWLYFGAWSPEHGDELWRSNGTDVTELVADINPARASSGPHSFEVMDGWLHFAATTAGAEASELWRSNGTVTERVGGPLAEVVFSGVVDAAKVLGPKWKSTIFTPSTSGDHTFTLEWAGTADVRISVKEFATGTRIGRNISSDQPKALTVDLQPGVDYRVAVWAKSDSADFTVTVQVPPLPAGEVIVAGIVDNTKTLGPRWTRTFYTPVVSGDHDLVLDWSDGGWLCIGVRERVPGKWVGSDITSDYPSKTLTVSLQAGTEYRVAVWSKLGAGEFTVTVFPPGG